MKIKSKHDFVKIATVQPLLLTILLKEITIIIKENKRAQKNGRTNHDFLFDQTPSKNGKDVEFKRSLTPIPMDNEKCGFYGDRIYNAHNSVSRFSVVTFGYSKSWKETDIYDRQIDRYTIHFVFQGKGYFNGQPISAGQMFFAPQNQKYSVVNSTSDPLTLAWIALSGTELENQLSLLRLPKNSIITYFDNTDDIERIFIDTVYEEHSKNDMELFLFSRFYEVLSLCQAIDPPITVPDNDQTSSYFSKIMSFINTHYSESIKVPDVAKHAHISVAYLRRICALKIGKSPQELITEKRLNVAKALLSNDTSTVEEIAVLVGFSNTATFSKSFKRNFGVSPLAYRKQKNQEKRLRAQCIARTENN